MPLLALTGQELDGVKLEAELLFPARIKQALGKWRVGAPATIGDREVQPVQGTTAGGRPRRYASMRSRVCWCGSCGFPSRRSAASSRRLTTPTIARSSGVKMPFRWTVSWLDGRSTFELSDVQPNVPIDAAKFARPAVGRWKGRP